MTALIRDASLEAMVIKERQARGADKYDEVWDGVYVMSPLPTNEHQSFVMAISSVILQSHAGNQTQVFAGVNVSNRNDDWTKNYRIPDIAVFLANGVGEDRGTHWYGGPDVAFEIVSPSELPYEKFEFYESTGAQELFILNRSPWELSLYCPKSGKLELVETATVENSQSVESSLLGLSLEFVAGEERPMLEIEQQATGQSWSI